MERNKVLVMCSILLFFIPFALSKQNNSITITQGQSIKDDETLVSASETFEAGFFSLESSEGQYFGIWYKSISPKTIVWVANRDTPTEKSTAILKLTDQGNLLIADGSKGIVWSSNASGIAKKPFMQLLDSGNLVVKDGDNGGNILWESFDYPGNTLLSGMKIKRNLVTGPPSSLTSWKNTEDPGVGEFSFHTETHGYPQLFLTKGTKQLTRSGPWIGTIFVGAAQLRQLKILKLSILLTGQEISFTYETLNRSIVTRIVLTAAGTIQHWIWSSGIRSWEIVSTYPSDQCDYYALCGPNSNCNTASYPICECLQGFFPKFQAKWNSLDNSDGCVRMKNLSCESGDGFLKYSGVKLPDTYSSRFDPSKSLDECMALCLQNCSCTAYACLNGRNGCLNWFGDILDMRKTNQLGQDIYIRVDASELDHKRNKRNFNSKKLAVTLVGIITFIICITILGLATSKCIKRTKKIEKPGIIKGIQLKDNKEDEDIGLGRIFDFSTISYATNQFSLSNKIGEGGFGSVYKGQLEDGQEIAVKRLSNTSEQGIKEFKNEVMLVAKLQHRNLVKLIGCSIHQDEKLLIYEFMHNRSLDYFIFDPMQRKLVDWNKRFQIINGIARGLLYLHQDSRVKIIHRDIKTSNILLDKEMNPKISDFGLARTFRVDQVEAKTRRVMGTYGYMPPEYVLHGSFSIKSDVFSFGIIVLEIICGKKNTGFCDPQSHLNLLSHAWRLWIEERPLELTDDLPSDSVTSSEIVRYIHVGLLCVQQRPEKRPNMSSVVLILNGEKVPPSPSQPAFYTGQDDPVAADSSSGNCERFSRCEVSISLEAR